MNCPFCTEYVRPAESQFYRETGRKIGRRSRVLLETDNWYVIPTMGCLTVGYVLLVTKQHYLSLAGLDRGPYLEMLDLKRTVEEILFRRLGTRCLTFEHGTADPGSRGANSVSHAHVHLLPFAQPVWQDILPQLPAAEVEAVGSYGELWANWQKHTPGSYLLFQDLDQRIYYIPDAHEMPSQLFRRCLAPLLGADCWDWRREHYPENIVRTIGLFEP